MPELPEVEAARVLSAHALQAKHLQTVFAPEDSIVLKAPRKKIITSLQGARVENTGRHGKYFWLELDRKPWPLIHLGMSGRIVTAAKDSPRSKAVRLEVGLEDGRVWRFEDPRRLGRVRLVREPRDEAPLNGLGPDAYHELPGPRAFATLFGARRAQLKSLLLDQEVLAGIGNWIADELLYQAKLDPRRLGCDLSLDELRTLRTSLQRILRRAVSVGADENRFPRHWLFHRRWGKRHATTVRGEPLRYDTVAGRTTAWVPSIQK